MVSHEDEGALCGGADGLDVVRDLVAAAPRLLRPDGPGALWLEVDASHPPLIEEWLRDGAEGVRMERWMADAGGLPRFVELRLA